MARSRLPAAPGGPRTPRGFTLLEVMIGLALLGLALTVLIKSAAGNIFSAQQAHMIGVATDLARGKMYDIEDKLIKDGFSDTEQHEEDRPFTDEGWPSIHYSYKVEVIELPGWDQLQKLAQCTGKSAASSTSSGLRGNSAGSGSAKPDDSAGSDAAGGCFQDSMIGGMMSQFTGFSGVSSGSGKGGADVGSQVGASFVQAQYGMFQQILKQTIRKVTLTLNWQVMGSDRDMAVVAFFTDASAMDKVLSGMGTQDLDDKNRGSGSGSGP